MASYYPARGGYRGYEFEVTRAEVLDVLRSGNFDPLVGLAETIDVLARIGVRRISLRRLTAVDVGASEFVFLSPRMALLADDLVRAATTALRRVPRWPFRTPRSQSLRRT